MSPNPFAGVVLHAIGGLAAGSFYLPFKRVRGWAWESFWLVGGLFSWLLAPWVAAMLFCPNVLDVLRAAPSRSVALCYFFGVLWGIGGLTFGLSMRYLGLSLGYALALGFCAAFGTVLPPLFNRQFLPMLSSISGGMTLLGVVVCLAGIAVCAAAGQAKERAMGTDRQRETIQEFNLSKGFWVAVFAGVMSACMAFGIAAGKPIAQLAIDHGAPVLWQNTPVFIVILAGGLTTNLVWCVALNFWNGTGRDYLQGGGSSLAGNYLFCALAGITWYLQFFFYGMGTTQMGRYDFSSWTIHMAFIIIFSTCWGLLFHEWNGAGSRARRLVAAGLCVLVASTLLIGLGNWLASVWQSPTPSATRRESNSAFPRTAGVSPGQINLIWPVAGPRSVKRRPVAGLLPLDLLGGVGFDMAICKGEVHALHVILDRMSSTGIRGVCVIVAFGQAQIRNHGL